MNKFVKWNDLNQFHEVVKNLNYPRIYDCLRKNDYVIPYAFKIKIHGTNACVSIGPDGEVNAQKRSSNITAHKDNAGFAYWVDQNRAYFESLAHSEFTLYIFGEWAGPGVQSGVACSMTDKKMFYPFAIDAYKGEEFCHRVYDPGYIEGTLGDTCPNDIIVLPWHMHLDIGFEAKIDTEKALSELNTVVEAIGERDPFFKEYFDLDGCGEGLVAFPLLGKEFGVYNDLDELTYFSWFNFKAKSEAHRVNKTKTAAQFDPQKFENANRFADAFCTEQRFMQGFKEAVNEQKDIKLTGQFIQWVVKDIYKESTTERAEMDDSAWKSISKTCTTRAALWFKERVNEL